MRKHVLVIGSTGTMGRYVVPSLVAQGYRVTGLSLDDEVPCSDRVTCIKGNAMDKEYMTRLLTGQRFDGIINFMSYPAKYPFTEWYRLFLDNTDHFIFLSSCRVYADEEWPVKETSPRLLDVSKDEALLASNDYCMHKARAEDLLWASGYKNFTIVRPATIYSSDRLALTTLETANVLGRARRGKKVVLPIQCKDKPATLCWGGDVGPQIAHLIFKPEAMGEAFNVCSSESRTWGEIAEYYHTLCGLEAVWVDKEDYLRIKSSKDPVDTGSRWQLEYARMFHRITDNSKVLKVTGLKQETCISLFEGLKKMIAEVPAHREYLENGVDARMDAYLEEHGL